jgi:hypothetical protein
LWDNYPYRDQLKKALYYGFHLYFDLLMYFFELFVNLLVDGASKMSVRATGSVNLAGKNKMLGDVPKIRIFTCIP